MADADLTDFNARWLKAWSDKDVEGLLKFYADEVQYFDPQVPHGVRGQAELRDYLTKLFGSTPPMRYTPHEIWTTPTGYCGRWYCVIGDDPAAEPALRGFDLVVMQGDRIALNEVYVHPMSQTGAAAIAAE